MKKKRKICGIYYIENLDTGRKYVGQSVDIMRRWHDHKKNLRKNSHKNIYLQRAWNEYGEEGFVHRIIEECTIENLNEREIYWIAHLDANVCYGGYNLEFGGKVQKEISEETREKLSRSLSGKRNGVSRAVVCLETKEVFDTIAEAEKKYGISKGCVSNCCRKKRKQVGNKHWRYYEDYLSMSNAEKEYIIRTSVIGNRREVININTLKVYRSMREAQSDCNIPETRISACCRGIKKSCGKDETGKKIVFQYYNNYLENIL